MHKLLGNLRAIEYPSDKLDVKLLLEGDDDETIDAALRDAVGAEIEIVLVPPGRPAHEAQGAQLRTDDRPRRVRHDLRRRGPPRPAAAAPGGLRVPAPAAGVVCLQAELTFDNTDQNLITRWFTTEYLMWFTLFLPGLVVDRRARAARRDVEPHPPRRPRGDRRVGRVQRHRGRRPRDPAAPPRRPDRPSSTSVTYEEANSDFVNWMKQRSRWYKGYLQTWLVHLRHPVASVPRARARAASCSTTCSSAGRRCSRSSTRSSG